MKSLRLPISSKPVPIIRTVDSVPVSLHAPPYPRSHDSSSPVEPNDLHSIETGNHQSKNAYRSDKESCCQICQNNQARYTCPKCEVLYCSLDCYRQHGDSDNPSSSAASSSCTEAFYSQRVDQVLKLEIKERKQQTRAMLNRSFHQQQLTHQQEGLIDTDSHEARFTKDELVRLLTILERDDLEELDRFLADYRNGPELQIALAQSIQTGELNEYILDPWEPWWRTQLASVRMEADIDQEKADDLDSVSLKMVEAPLDERLLNVRQFRSLRPSSQPDTDLSFNLVDILYATVWTLRLYHGPSNALDAAVDAAASLVGASGVLGRDKRWGCTEQVLAACTTESTKAVRSGIGCHVSWNTLTKDVELLCTSVRLIARALLEATDIFKAARQVVNKSGLQTEVLRWRKARKKVEFYLSWSLSHAQRIPRLKLEIHQWRSHWESDNEDLSEVFLPS
jgi:hypothetical protein